MQSQSMLARLTPLFAVVTLPLGILAAIVVSLPAALAVVVVGWLLLTPAAALLSGPQTATGLRQGWADEEVQELVQERMKEKIRENVDESVSNDPIEELRERYARGEIDEAELERRLDALLEMEDVDPTDEESVERAKRALDTAGPRESAADSRGGGAGASEESGELETERE